MLENYLFASGTSYLITYMCCIILGMVAGIGTIIFMAKLLNQTKSFFEIPLRTVFPVLSAILFMYFIGNIGLIALTTVLITFFIGSIFYVIIQDKRAKEPPYYIVVNGKQLKGPVDNFDNYFFGTDEHSRRFSEEEYKKWLEDSQPYFAMIKEKAGRGTKIYNPKEKTAKGSIFYSMLSKPFSLWYDKYGIPVDLSKDYFGNNAVRVNRCFGGYRYGGNGRHRFYVAQKYGLDILVHVTNEKW